MGGHFQTKTARIVNKKGEINKKSARIVNKKKEKKKKFEEIRTKTSQIGTFRMNNRDFLRRNHPNRDFLRRRIS